MKPLGALVPFETASGLIDEVIHPIDALKHCR